MPDYTITIEAPYREVYVVSAVDQFAAVMKVRENVVKPTVIEAIDAGEIVSVESEENHG